MKTVYKKLDKILSSHFVKFSLIPILVVEVTLLIMYFSINAYISSKNVKLLLNEAQTHTQALLLNEANFISDKLNEVSRLARILQAEHQTIFENPKGFAYPNGKPSFEKAENGVFYKTNNVGASLYYSANTKIDKESLDKALFTEAMDINLKNIVDANPNIVASYFNSWDNMNRLYPFIDKVYEQYGSHIQMEDYNFYYLADLKHNPKKEPAWTGAYLDPAGNGWMLSCIVPIYKNDFLEGVTGLDITIDDFVKNILNRKLPYGANLFMVDETGMIIAMSEKIENLLGLKELKEHLYTDAILKTIEKPEKFNILTNASPFAAHFKNLIENNKTMDSLKISNKEYLTLQQNVDETSWKLMILIDKDNIFKTINELKELSNKIGYIAIALLLVFYVIFFYLLLKKIRGFSKTITEPIEKLSDETSQIKTTDSKIELLDTDISEIYTLNSNFVTMMNELNERTQRLYEAKVEAEELSKAKDDFLANMSHELKTPLNSINVISDVMAKNRSGKLDEKQVKNLQIINKCGKDLLFLINDVLDLSKLEAGQIIVNNSSINLKDLMSSIYDMFYPQTKMKNIDFVMKIDESLESIYSDEDRIKQIIKNLLSNALKFTEKGRISLVVKDDKENIRIIVEDEGIGIPKDKLEHIFDRFKQVDGSTTRKYGGTGLGLAICKELAMLLKGDVYVSSELDKGSKFEVTIAKNEGLLESLALLDIKNKQETIFKSNEERIFIYNSDPVTNIELISKVRNYKNIIQVMNLEDIKNNKEYILIDLTRIDENDIKIINENNIRNIVGIRENNIKVMEIEDRIVLSINKIMDDIELRKLMEL